MGYCECGYDKYDDCMQYECRKYLPRELARAAADFSEAQRKALEDYKLKISKAIRNAKHKQKGK